jgi:hypothetical protein
MSLKRIPLMFGVAPVVCLASALMIIPGQAFAQDAPPAYEASPEVYKIIGENEQFRVIEATWQPGQEDEFHSHPPDRVHLYRTNCELQITNADGSQRIAKPKVEMANIRTGKPVASHKAKNVGSDVCIIRIIELK